MEGKERLQLAKKRQEELKMDKIIIRAFRPGLQKPCPASPLADRTGKLWTGQGKHGYYENLSQKEKEELPIVIDHHTRVVLSDNKVIDLTDPIDTANWMWLQFHPYLVLDRKDVAWQRDAVFYVDNPEKEARERVTKSKLVDKVRYMIQYESSHEDKIRAAKALGLPGPEALSDTRLTDWLLDFANSNPSGVMTNLDAKNSAESNIRIFFNDLTAAGIINKDSGVFKYGEGEDATFVGSTEDAVIDFIKDKKNKEVVKAMKALLVEKEV